MNLARDPWTLEELKLIQDSQRDVGLPPKRAARPPDGYWWVKLCEPKFELGEPLELRGEKVQFGGHHNWNIVQMSWHLMLFDKDSIYTMGSDESTDWKSIYEVPVQVGPQVVEPDAALFT